MKISFFQKIYSAFFHETVRLYRLLPGYFKRRFWVLFVLQVIMAISEASTILMVTLFALSMATPQILHENVVTAWLLTTFPTLDAIFSDHRYVVLSVCFLVVVFILFKNVITAYTHYKTTIFSEKISAYIGREALQRYLNKPYHWHLSKASGDVFHKLSQRSSLTTLLVNTLMLYSNVICATLMFATLFVAQPDITIIVVISFSLVGLGVYLGLRRRMDHIGRKIAEATARESGATLTAIRGIREVLIYRQQPVFLGNIVEGMEAGIRPRAFHVTSGLLPALFLEAAGFITICGVLAFLVYKDSTMPQIIAASSMLMLTAWRVLPSVSRSLGTSVIIRSLRPQASICLDLLETFLKEDIAPQAQPDPDFIFSRDLALDKVSFCYPENAQDSLLEICLRIPKGSSVGIVGVSGAGKSTLAGIIAGLLTPTAGEMRVDGKSLDASGLAAYRERVGLVPQNPFLLGGTVADNVAFSQWGRTYDRDDVVRACRRAAMEFVFSHAQGIDMPVGEGGGGLSGGQAQRVSIARALFINPDLIIFDEATSALDQASENIIRETIRRLQGQVTAVIIAHRLSTVAECDTIVWMDQGRVKMSGSPQEILPQYEYFMQNAARPCAQTG